MVRAMTARRVLGVLGGSGLNGMRGLQDVERRRVSTPFGSPSDELVLGQMEGTPVVFLARHGAGHRLMPSEVNYRANIYALKAAGVTDLLSLSAVGSLKEELPPGHFVIVDQFIDRTFKREKTFFGQGVVAHVSCADPVCQRMGDALQVGLEGLGYAVTRGGAYLCMEGPQFSTRAESEMYRSWGCSVIGMTNMPEANLAREAELCYASVGMVTDYDCWRVGHAAVEVSDIIEVLLGNADRAQSLVKHVAPSIGFLGTVAPDATLGVDSSDRSGAALCPHGCQQTLDSAIITAPAQRDPATLEKLAVLLNRHLSRNAV